MTHYSCSCKLPSIRNSGLPSDCIHVFTSACFTNVCTLCMFDLSSRRPNIAPWLAPYAITISLFPLTLAFISTYISIYVYCEPIQLFYCTAILLKFAFLSGLGNLSFLHTSITLILILCFFISSLLNSHSLKPYSIQITFLVQTGEHNCMYNTWDSLI